MKNPNKQYNLTNVNLKCMDFGEKKNKIFFKVPPRFELGLLDSESRVLTITPWNLINKQAFNFIVILIFLTYIQYYTIY